MKNMWQSKTIWFNFLTLLVNLLMFVLQYLDQLFVDDFHAAIAAIVINAMANVINLYLRKITSQAIK